MMITNRNAVCLDLIDKELNVHLDPAFTSIVRSFIGFCEPVLGESTVEVVEKVANGVFKEIRKEKIYLVAFEEKFKFKIIQAYTADGKVLGEIILLWARHIDGNFTHDGQPLESDIDSIWSYGPDYPKTTKLSKIFVEDLRSPESENGTKDGGKIERYRGVGTTLMYAALFFSVIQDCDGRIMLDAEFGSHGFYYKPYIGMRAVKNEEHSLITQRMKSGVSSKLCTVFLPEGSISNIYRLARQKLTFIDPNHIEKLESFDKANII